MRERLRHALTDHGSMAGSQWPLEALKKEARNHTTLFFVVLFFLMQSSLVTTAFEMFHCELLFDGRRYLVSDYDEVCFTLLSQRFPASGRGKGNGGWRVVPAAVIMHHSPTYATTERSPHLL